MAGKENVHIEDLARSDLFGQISDICAAVNTVTDAKELLEISLMKTLALLKAKRGSIFILDGKQDKLTLKIAQGLNIKEQDKMIKKLGEGVVGLVAKTKNPIFVDDISKDTRFKDFKARKSYKTPSFICAPLLLKDNLIGVINIADKDDESRFSKNELQLLDFLASQIALNYRRIQLYRKFQSIVKESKSLKHELGRSSQVAKDLKKQVVQHERLASIGKLAGGIAHEFNNPLDGVMRYTNLCLEHTQDDEVVRGYLLEIKEGLNRMANIVKNLLACARSSDVTVGTVKANDAVEQVLRSLNNSIVHKGITVKKDLAEDLPELPNYGLERAIANVVKNAIDAVDDKGLIHVSTRLEDGDVVVGVKDNGCGIDETQIEEIFEPFHTTKDIDKGCGLGLTIVSEIIKAYNGHITIESRVKKGTEFTIMIPLNSKDE